MKNNNFKVILHLNETYAEFIGVPSEIEYTVGSFELARELGEDNDYEPTMVMGYEIIDSIGKKVFATDVLGNVVLSEYIA